MLIGQYKSKLTEKGRIAVPKKLRSDLGGEMVIARWYEGCLVMVSKTSWRRLLERLSGVSGPVTSPVRDVDRFVLGMAYEIKLDKQGRFILSESLKKYSGISDEVVFVGLRDRVELWAAEKWEEFESIVQERAFKAIETIAEKQK